MSTSIDRPHERRTTWLWVLALGVVVADAAVFYIGLGFGLLGIVAAICVILWTQRRADGWWRAHHSAGN